MMEDFNPDYAEEFSKIKRKSDVLDKAKKIFDSLMILDANKLRISNDDRLRYIIRHLTRPENEYRLLGAPAPNVKSSEISTEYRKEGDKYFEKNELSNALEEYTKSIAYALPNSQELAVAYASRSVVLFRGKLITDSLLDIYRALENPFPDNSKSRLYLHKAICIQVLSPNNRRPIDEAFNEAYKWLEKLDSNNQEIMRQKIDNQKNSVPSGPMIYYKWNPQDNPLNLINENQTIPGLSDSTKIKYSKKYGRHIIATRDIKAGEIIGVQKPYVKIINNDMRYNLCWNCGKQTWSSIPCTGCAEVIFCSNNCRQFANNNYHDIECFIMIKTHAMCIDDSCLIGLRFAIMALKECGMSFESLKKKLLLIDRVADPLKKGFTNGKLYPDKFESTCALISTPPSDIRKNGLILSASIFMAYFFARKIEIIPESWNDISVLEYHSNFIFLIGLIEKNICQSIKNGFDVDIPTHKDELTSIMKVVVPAFSFFNHSCDIMTTKSIRGDSIVTTAICPIAKGQQIFFTYGPSYACMSREERQKFNEKNFHLICHCEPCLKNWPILPDDFIKTPSNNDIFFEILSNKIRELRERVKSQSGISDDLVRENNGLIDLSENFNDAKNLLDENYELLSKYSPGLYIAKRILDKIIQISQRRLILLD